MSKATKTHETKTIDATSFEGKTNDEIEEIVKNLQAQLQQKQIEAQQAQTMVLKIQGALEMALQMLPPEETTNDTKSSN
mgnify:CR=1 FL=1|tara:strand:+ start:734 stop:970 length:237 start_codon:yes stop_codon:yes gene_type:complete